MAVFLYNSLTRKKETFEPLKNNLVRFYSCGPTVYSYQHIGNLRTYVFNDILKRTLLFNGYEVKHVMNYTDVGHLSSDADTGEDRMEKAAQKEHKSAQDIAAFYAEIFEKDCVKLNIMPPDIICRATQYIKEQIEMVQVLEEKGFTYRTSDGIYFDTSKVEDYGQMGQIDEEGLEAGKRVDIGEKKRKTDFALWKLSEKPGLRQQEWNSPWGIGFPGWHTECCVMSSKHLGKQFDIHTGGEDHITVHHPNEIAQAEAAFGVKPWVRFWLHGAFLLFKGEKVSKSKGGLYTISELEEMGFAPLAFRYLCLNTHYKKQLHFSLNVLEGAANALNRLHNLILEYGADPGDQKTKSEKKYSNEFRDAINDDLNMPRALSVLWSVLRDKDLDGPAKRNLALKFDQVLGLGLENLQEKKQDAPEDVLKLVEEREKARKDKNFARADAIRDELLKLGYSVNDTSQGPKLKMQNSKLKTQN
ncbi:MAG: cysteine--tRNA ligase [Candidatus Aminicenantes bacterium]|nr:cysteine--tRNA ligase [Candidatus Aminicenantes bacterium]